METKKDAYSDIIDEDNYSWGNQGKIDIKKIITAHIDRISKFIFSGNNPEFVQNKNGRVSKTNERREATIDAMEFLIGLVEPFYDEDIEKKQKKFLEIIKEKEIKFLEVSSYNEAYNRAVMDKNNSSEAFNYWLKMFKNKFSFFDKDSSEYEHFLYIKYSIMMKLFKEINHLLKRKHYLEDEDYEE